MTITDILARHDRGLILCSSPELMDMIETLEEKITELRSVPLRAIAPRWTEVVVSDIKQYETIIDGAKRLLEKRAETQTTLI